MYGRPTANFFKMFYLCVSSQLMNESEATVMRLTEQAKILKDEIRRMERNQDRERELANMEYLKNIIMQVSLTGIHPYNADANFDQSTKTLRFLKNI